MTKRQKMLLNKATIQRKEHYKMYKSGSTWAFTCIVLMAGVFWSVPTVTAQAAGTPTDTATKQVVTGSSTDTTVTPTAATTQTATSVKSSTTATPSATTPTSTDGSTTTATQNKITTANLNSTNPANLNADGTVSRTDMTNVKTSSVQDVQDNFKAQRISKVNGTVQKHVNISDTISNGGVTLVPAATANTAGTLVFKNQIDTSQAFTFNATFTSSMAGGGGGIGFLLQPVDPQDAGVGEGSDPSADIGIYGQPNTTFIGRDGYVDTSDNSKKADTDWTNLTIRQTDSNGLLTGSTPTWSNSSSPAKPSNATIPLTEYATLTWTPTSGVVDHKVTGTLTYTTYKDAARTQQVQTLTTSSATYIPTTKLNSITLNQSVSIAAFGATGNENDKRSVQVASTTGAGASEGGFTAKVNTMPIKITYVDQDGSTPLHDADTTNVNVGDSLTIAPTTDLSTNTFAPRVINGYRFVKAVASDGTDTITVSNSVLNALTSNPNVNNIVVYYTNKVSYTIQPVNALGQNIAGLAPTQGTATIGDSITAPIYTGYVPSTPSVLAPTTDGTTLKLAYSAVASSVTVSYEGLPTSLPSNTVNGSIGSTYNIVSPTVPGYTADQAALSGTFATEGNTKLTVKYTPSSNSYQVIPVDEYQKVIATLPVQTESSTTGDPIVAPTYAGYKLVDSTNLPTTQGGVTSYQLSYQAIPYNVQVTYTGLPAGQQQSAGSAEGTIGTVYQINSPIVAGYTPDKPSITGTFADGGTTSFTVNYTADNAIYKVQPVDANNVPITTLEPQLFNGTTGDPIETPTYAGYTVQPTDEKVPVPASVTPTINVKYTANSSSVIVTYAGLPASSTVAKSATFKGVTDATYQITVPTVAGYTPNVSVLNGIYSNAGSDTKTITYTPNDNSYTITPVDADGNPIAGLSTVSASTKTDSQIEMPDYSDEGYELVPSQAIVTKPGVSNYQVEYQADTQKITVSYAGLPTSEANLAPVQTQTVKVGDSYNFVSPTITGYTPDIPVVSGVYAKGGESSFKVTYTPMKETVTIAAAGLDPDSAAKYVAVTQTGNYGDSFSIPVTNVAGYKPDEAFITGTYGADSTSNMHVVTYTGQPASVKIVYSVVGNGATAPASVTLTGIVGGSYTQDSPRVINYVSDQSTVSGMFTAADVTQNNATISVKYVTGSNIYVIQPVDASGHSISELSTTTIGTSDGKTVQVPDFSDQGYITDKTTANVADANSSKIIDVVYLKQVSYTIQPVGLDNVPISTLSPITTTATVGSQVTPPIEAGYELVNPATTYTITDTTSTVPIQYKVKPVSIALVPVDGNGQAISGLGKWLISNKPVGGTVINVTPPNYSGYQLKSNDNLNISVPIQDGQLIVPVTYLKMFTAKLTGTESETYTGASQTPDSDNYKVNLPDGTSYALSANDLQIVSSDATNTVAKNVGIYNVQLTDAAKKAISDSLSQNYAVTVEDNATFTITPAALTVPTANTAKIPVNVSNPSQNPQLATSIVIQGSTKVYDGDASSDSTFKVLAPSQYKDFNIPTLLASDFDLSSISQNAGNYEVKLNDQGLQALKDQNPNYSFDSTDIQSGLFVISKAPVTVTAKSVTTQYNGQANGGVTIKADVSGRPAKGVDVKYTVTAGSPTDASSIGYPITITASETDNPNYDVKIVNGTLEITPIPATIQISDSSKVYDGTMNMDPAKFTVTGTTGMVIPQLTADDFSGITSADVGHYSIKLSDAGIAALQNVNKNYAFSSANVTAGDLNITPAHITITAPSETVTYNGQVPTVPTEGTVTVQDGQIGTPVAYTISSDVSTGVKNYTTTVNLPADGNANYAITTVNGTVTVKANTSAAVTLSDANKVYDGTTNVAATDFKVTGPTDMIIPDMKADDFDFSDIKSDVGQYSVTLNETGIAALQSANKNYTITSDNATASHLNITPAHITITAPSKTMTYNGQVPILPKETVTVQDGKIGTPVSYTITNNVKANAGGYTTTVELPADGNKNYAITAVNGTVTISKDASAKVTLSDANKVYDGTTNVVATDFKVTGPANMIIPDMTADDFDFSNIKSDVGQYSVTLNETGIAALQSANKNYTITSDNAMASHLNITPAHITITAPSKTVTYNGQVPILPKETVTVQDGKIGTPVAYTISSDVAAGVKDYTTTVNLPADGNANYAITTVNGTVTVKANASAEVKLSDANKVYDGTTNVAATDFKVTGPTDMIIPDMKADDFDFSDIKSDVGQYSVKLSKTGIDALQNANTNYTITNSNVTVSHLNITPAHITITAPSKTVTYNGQVPILPKETVMVQDGKIGTPVSYTISNNVKANAGEYTTTVELPADGNKNYAITAVNGTVTITKDASAKVTLSDANKVYDGTTNVAASDFKVTGPANMVIPTLTAVDFDFSGIESDVGDYSVKLNETGIAALQSANANYAITNSNVSAGRLNITPAHITITAPSKTVTYNGQVPILPKETVTVQDGKIGTPVSYTISNNVKADAGGYTTTVELPADGNKNYAITAVNGTVTITKDASAKVTLSDANKVYDGTTNVAATDFKVTGPTDMIIPDMKADDFDFSDIKSDVGQYSVKLSKTGIDALQNANTNYTITNSNVTVSHLNITPAHITITAPSKTVTYNGQVPILPKETVTVQDGEIGTPVSYTISNNVKADAGGYTTTVELPADGNKNYAITAVNGTVTITKDASAKVTLSDANKVYDGTTNVAATDFKVTGPTDMIIPDMKADDFDFSDIKSDVGQYSVKLSKTGIDALQNANTNYTITNSNVTVSHLNITPAHITITAPSKTVTYNGQVPILPKETVTVQDGKIGTPVSYTISNNVKANAGEYTTTVELPADGNKNYAITAVNGTVTITKDASAKVTLSDDNKVYDGTTNVAATDFKVTGPADMVIPALTADDFDFSGIDKADVGQYSVELSQAGINALQTANANYTITNSNLTVGHLNITPAHITITAPSKTVTYNGQVPILPKETVTVQDGKIGTPVSYTISNNVKANAGEYTTTVELPADGNKNYAITAVNGTVTITKDASAKVTLSDANKVYDGTTNVATTDFKVTGPTDMMIPTLTADDFDFSGIDSANVGSYSIKLSDTGVKALQAANKNYTITSSNVTAGNLNITPDTNAKVQINNGAKEYDDTKAVATTSITLNLPTDMNVPTWTIDDFDFSGVTSSNVGNYQISLSDKGINDLQAVNENYTIARQNVTAGNFQITQKDGLTIDVTGGNKTYDGTAVQYALTLPDGVQTPNNWSAADYSLAAPVDAGTYTVTLSDQGVQDLQAANPNYDLQSAKVTGGTFTISKANVTITAKNESMIYSGEAYKDANLEENVSGKPNNGADLKYTLTANGATNVNDTGYAIKVIADSADNPNYNIQTVDGKLTITPAPITVTAPTISKTYDGKAYSGDYRVSVDGVPENGVQPTFGLTDISGDVNAGTYTLTASGENTGNYAVTYKAGSLTINKADLTAAITNQTKVYDNNSAKDPKNYTLQLSTGDQLTLTSSDFKISANNGGNFSQNVGSYTVSLNDDGVAAVNEQMPNYNLATASVSAGQFTITPQQVDAGAISVDSATKVYDGDANTDPETYGLTISDEYPEVVIPADLTADDFDIMGITSQNVGNYAVKLTQSGIEKLNQANTNYLINADSISSGQLQITKRPVTLTADDVQKVYDGHSYNKVGTAKRANLTSSGTPLVYTVNVPKNVDTVSDAPITITADKAANSNYEITTVDGKLTIAAKALADNAITISQATKTYDDDASNVPAFSLSAPDVTANPNFVMPTSLTTADFNTTTAASQNVGNYDVTLTDSGLQKLQAVNPNYVISSKSIGSGSLSITSKAITISAPTLSKTYDGNAYSGADLTGTVTGQIGDQQIVYFLTDLSQDVDAGEYEIDATVDSTAAINQNYDIQTTKGNLTINKAPVTIAAPQGLTKMYDGSGYALNDNAATVIGKPDHGATVSYHLSSLENAVNAGTYSVNVTDTANNPNYDITVVPSTFTVTKNTKASVQIGSASKTYDNDENTDPQTYAVTLPAGVATPDSWSVDDFKLSANSQNVGSYTVTLSDSGIQKLNAANSNYLFNADNVKAGQLTIKPAPITVTAPSISQTYDGAAYAGDYSAKVSGTPVNATSPSFTLTDISQDVNAGTYGIQATATGDISNYAITYVDGTLTITPQALGQTTVNSVASPANNDDPADNHQADDFVVVQGATKVYDGDATTDPTTYQVLAPSDYADFNVPTFTADDFTSVSDGQDAGKHVVTLTAAGLAKLQAANKNYQFDAQSIQNGLLVITPAPISIAAPTLTKQYDGQAYQESVMPVVTGVPANGVAPVYTLSALNDDVNAGQYPIVVSFSPKDNPNYTISTSTRQLTITPITPQFRVMIDACYQLYSGQPADNQVYPVTISGADLVQPEWTAEDFVVSGTADAVGSYPVTLSSAGWKKLQQANPNDVINADPTKITPGALVIEPVSLAKADLGQIQVGSQTKVYDGLNDDPTDYTVTLPAKLTAPVWSASDFERQETSENAGTYSVTLSKSGLTSLRAVNPNYVINAEDITSGQLTITKAPITITAPSGLSKTDDGKPYSGATTGKVTGQPVNGSAVVYQVDYGNNGSVGTHLASIVADPKLNPNYEITTVSNNYQILPQPVVASTTDATKTVEAQFKQAVAEPVFYPAESKSGSTIEQVTLQIPATKELDQAKEIIASAPERAELIFSSQSGSASKHGQSSSKHSTSSTSKQGVKGRTQETKQSNPNHTSSGNVESGNASFESRTAYQRSMKLKRQSANPSTIAGAKHLPQTDETQSSLLAVLGATLMSLLGMLGVKKRKSDQ